MRKDNLDEIDNQDFSEEIPKSEGSVVWHLLSQVKIGMSLQRVTLPTFILEPRSTIERLSDWMIHADILRKMSLEKDPLIRCLHLCTWIVSGFHMSPRTPKKPYNSLLGEVFRAVLNDDNGHIIGTYTAEQVSHHPPISAFHYCDRAGGAVVWGHAEMRSKFLGNSIAALMDHENTRVNLDLPNIGETYEFNLPNMYGRGIFVGRLMMEICGEVKIKCLQTGVTAKIHFKEKPMMWGRYNCFEGEVCEPVKTHIEKAIPKIRFNGRWSAFMQVTDLRSNKQWLSFDVRTAKPLKVVTPDINEQCEYESQYTWKYVTEYISRKDTQSATEHKLALEEKQRLERQYYEENNIPWKLQCFHWDEQLNRYVPNNINLTKYEESEPPMEMPPPFHIPEQIVLAQDAGISVPIPIIHTNTEMKLHKKPSK